MTCRTTHHACDCVLVRLGALERVARSARAFRNGDRGGGFDGFAWRRELDLALSDLDAIEARFKEGAPDGL